MCEHSVFISYAGKDYYRYKISDLTEALKLRGISFWIDMETRDCGAEFMSEIIAAIDNCTVFVCLSSIESRNSPYVTLEVLYAHARNKRILPVKLDEEEYNPQLTGILNNLTFFEPDPDNKINIYSSLINSIVKHLRGEEDPKKLYRRALENKERNYSEYEEEIKNAAERGYLRAMIVWGEILEAKKDYYNARKWLDEAVNSPEPAEAAEAKLHLARFILKHPSLGDPESVQALLEEASSQGLKEAYIELGDYVKENSLGWALDNYRKASDCEDVVVRAKALSRIAISSFNEDYVAGLMGDNLDRLLEAADDNDPDALYLLGWFYENGWVHHPLDNYYGISDGFKNIMPLWADEPLNYQKEYRIQKQFIIQAIRGDDGCMVRAAFIEKDEKTALKYYIQAAQSGSIDAMVRLAEDFFLFQSFEEVSRKKDGSCRLGELLFYNESMGLSQKIAVDIAKNASEMWISYANALVEKSPRVIDEAVAYWETVARKPYRWEATFRNERLLILKAHLKDHRLEDIVRSQYLLSSRLSDHNEIVRLQLLWTSAQKGWGPSQWALAVSTKDDDESFFWLLHYANSNSAIGAKLSLLLSKYYELGIGTSPDEKRCVYWLQKSAERGLSVSKELLAYRYEKGRGVPQDREEAERIRQIEHSFINSEMCQSYFKRVREAGDYVDYSIILSMIMAGEINGETLYDEWNIPLTLDLDNEFVRDLLDFINNYAVREDENVDYFATAHNEPFDNIYIDRLNNKLARLLE